MSEKNQDGVPIVGKSHRSRWPLWASILVCICAAVAIWVAWQKPWTDKPLITDSVQSVVTVADDMKYSGRPDDAAAHLKREIAAEKDDKTAKAYYTLQLATLYESQKKCEQALPLYRQVEQLKVQSIRAEEGIGRCSEAVGDKDTAILYYKLAYDNVDRSILGYESRLADYKARIERLGGKL